jgi:hypothetical protein
MTSIFVNKINHFHLDRTSRMLNMAQPIRLNAADFVSQNPDRHRNRISFCHSGSPTGSFCEAITSPEKAHGFVLQIATAQPAAVRFVIGNACYGFVL